MKLLTVTTSWPRDATDPSGRFVYELYEHLSQRGLHGPLVHLDAPPDGALRAWMSGERRRLALPLVRFMRDIQIAARGCDAVLAHWLIPSAVFSVSTGLPTIGVVHGGDVRILSNLAVLRGLVRSLAGVIAVSQELADACAAEHCLVTPMGVDTKRFQGRKIPATHVLRALFIGRITPIKGLEVLLEAAQGLPVEVTVAGDGPELSRLKAKYSNANFLGNVSPTGIPALLQNADT